VNSPKKHQIKPYDDGILKGKSEVICQESLLPTCYQILYFATSSLSATSLSSFQFKVPHSRAFEDLSTINPALVCRGRSLEITLKSG